MSREPDLGEAETVQVTTDADGKPVYGARIKRHGKHTGGRNADGTLTEAIQPSGQRADRYASSVATLLRGFRQT